MGKKIKFVYTDKQDLERLCELVINKDYEVFAYNENVAKDKRSAYRIKNTYGARMTPFLVLESDEKKPRVFFTEGNGEVLRNFENYLHGYKKENFTFIGDFITKCKKMGLKQDYVINKIKEKYEN